MRTIDNPEQFRQKIVEKLSVYFEEPKHSINLERGVHNWAVKEATNRKIIKKWDNPFFVQLYLDHLRSVFINLKHNEVVNNINAGHIKAQDVAFMTHQELRPDVWDELIKAKSIRDMNKFNQNIESMTDTFTCRKCRQKKCSYYMVQLRSADEPMTLFIQCLNCGNRWKQ
jgi:DNA-directed RNA polymerase subunit M/transcription elongation factor TFIIS